MGGMVVGKETSGGVGKEVEGAFSPTPNERNERLQLIISIYERKVVVECFVNASATIIATYIYSYDSLYIDHETDREARYVEIYTPTQVIRLRKGSQIAKGIIERIVVLNMMEKL
ncbi:hypothetical protein ATG_18690 [Desulfurococcaceae archaeon AG1]|nr:hypothetical protein ATG_18690 [Desulfurococcaceae archaeon AG1]